MNVKDLERLVEVRRLVESGEAKARRETAGISLSAIASACEVDTSTVWRWETGQRSPRAGDALKYGRVLSMLAEAQAAVS
jgi:transcriptional regulator with XRE-family HTH domain